MSRACASSGVIHIREEMSAADIARLPGAIALAARRAEHVKASAAMTSKFEAPRELIYAKFLIECVRAGVTFDHAVVDSVCHVVPPPRSNATPRLPNYSRISSR